MLTEHYGDSLLPYLRPIDNEESKEILPRLLPIIVRSKIRYAKVRPSSKSPDDRLNTFPDSVLRGPRREIRYYFCVYCNKLLSKKNFLIFLGSHSLAADQ